MGWPSPDPGTNVQQKTSVDWTSVCWYLVRTVKKKKKLGGGGGGTFKPKVQTQLVGLSLSDPDLVSLLGVFDKSINSLSLIKIITSWWERRGLGISVWETWETPGPDWKRFRFVWERNKLMVGGFSCLMLERVVTTSDWGVFKLRFNAGNLNVNYFAQKNMKDCEKKCQHLVWCWKRQSGLTPDLRSLWQKREKYRGDEEKHKNTGLVFQTAGIQTIKEKKGDTLTPFPATTMWNCIYKINNTLFSITLRLVVMLRETKGLLGNQSLLLQLCYKNKHLLWY